MVGVVDGSTGAITPLYDPSGIGGFGPVGIEYVGGDLYIGSGNGGQYYVAAADGSSFPAPIAGTDTGCCEALDLAVDEATGTLYLAKARQPVSVGPLDGSTPSAALPSGPPIVAVHFDAATGRLFGSEDFVGVYELDPATGAGTLLAPASRPRGITYDAASDTVFFADRAGGAGAGIYSVSGSGGTAALEQASPSPYHVELAGGSLYWSDFDQGAGTGSISRAPVGGGPATVVASGPDLSEIRGIALIPTAGPSGPQLNFAGSCPGTINISITGLTPGGQFAVARSGSLGSFTIPGGGCAGTTLGIASPSLVGFFPSGSGSQSFMPSIGGGLCGDFVQLVDLDACATSNIEQF